MRILSHLRRAQKSFEFKRVDGDRKKRKTTHDKILECCNYFSTSEDTEDGNYDVTLVTYHNDDDHDDLMVGDVVEGLAKSLSE